MQTKKHIYSWQTWRQGRYNTSKSSKEQLHPQIAKITEPRKQSQMKLPIIVSLLLCTFIFNPFCSADTLDPATLISEGKYSQAITILQQKITNYEAKNDLGLEYANSLNQLSRINRGQSQFDEAEKLSKKALSIKKKILGENNPEYLASLNDLANVYLLAARYKEAENTFKEALNINKGLFGENHPYYSVSLANLALLYKTTGEYIKAEPLQKRAVQICGSTLGKESPYYTIAADNLAILHEALGRYDEAETLFKEVLVLREKILGKDHPDYANSLNSLGGLYRSRKKYKEAEPYYKEALALRQKLFGKENLEYLISLNNLALLNREMKQFKEAESMSLEATNTAQRILGDHYYTAVFFNNLALVYEELDKYNEAENTYKQALSINKKLLGPAHPDYGASLYNLALLKRLTGNYSEARELLNQSYSIEQKNLLNVMQASSEKDMHNYVEHAMNAKLDTMISLANSQKLNDQNLVNDSLDWTLRRKGVILDAFMGFKRTLELKDKDPKFATKIQRYRYLKQAINDSNLKQDDATLKQLKPEAEALEADLNKDLSKYYSLESALNADYKKVASKLLAKSALIEIIQSESYDNVAGKKSIPENKYFAYILKPDATVKLVDLGNSDKIDIAIDALRRHIANYSKALPLLGEAALTEEHDRLSRKLYDLLFAPLVNEMAGTETIYVSPDGQINLIAFESLVSQKNNYLLDDYDFVYLNSGRDLLKDKKQAGKGALVFADPDFSQHTSSQSVAAEKGIGGLTQLGDGELEGKLVTDALSKTSYGPVKKAFIGKNALEEELKKTEKIKLLHISTHGFYIKDGKTNPLLRSGLVLAGSSDDGFVTAEEISLLDLRGTDLVVLSACETALGEVKIGQGVYGLRRSFVFAGAETLVNTLYKVPNKDSLEMMSNFYAGLNEGKSKLVALREAKKKQMSKHKHPYYWASFILVGEPN